MSIKKILSRLVVTALSASMILGGAVMASAAEDLEETTRVTGTITWYDDSDAYETRPESVEIKLLADGDVIDSIEVTKDTTREFITSNEIINVGVGESFSIDTAYSTDVSVQSGLIFEEITSDISDAGDAIILDHYRADEAGVYIIEVTYKDAKKTIYTINVSDRDEEASVKSITVQKGEHFTIDEEEYSGIEFSDDLQEITKEDITEYVAEEAGIYTIAVSYEDGSLLIYTIEVTEPEEDASNEEDVNNEEDISEEGEEAETFDEDADTTEVTDAEENTDENSESDEADEEDVTEENTEEESVDENDDNSNADNENDEESNIEEETLESDIWEYEFTDLKKYKDGQVIEYTISETALDDYTTEIDRYDVSNYYKEESEDSTDDEEVVEIIKKDDDTYVKVIENDDGEEEEVEIEGEVIDTTVDDDGTVIETIETEDGTIETVAVEPETEVEDADSASTDDINYLLWAVIALSGCFIIILTVRKRVMQ